MKPKVSFSKKHLRTHRTLSFGVEELQQQKVLLRSTPVSQEQDKTDKTDQNRTLKITERPGESSNIW